MTVEGGDWSRRDVLVGLNTAGVTGTAGIIASTPAGAGGEGGTAQFPDGECVDDWPGRVTDQVDLAEGEATENGDIPTDGDLVLFVHGMFGDLDFADFAGDQQAAGFDAALTEWAVDVPLVAVMWPATATSGDVVGAGEAFAPWLEAHADDYDSLVILAHSAGSGVVLETLLLLAETDVTVTSVGLLGGSPPPESVCADGRYAPAITDSVTGEVYNYHSEGDEIICSGSPVDDEDFEAVGCTGSDCAATPENYADVDLTGVVDAHCNFFKPAGMVDDGESGVPAIVDRQFDSVRPTDGTLIGTVTAAGPVAGVTVAARNAVTGGTVATTTVDESGSFDLSLPPAEYVVRANGQDFRATEQTMTVTAETTTSVEFKLPPGPVTGDRPPLDLDGDGLYEDVDGDGTFDIFDVQALFANLDSEVVQRNADAFDFQNGDVEPVTVADVQALFRRLRGG